MSDPAREQQAIFLAEIIKIIRSLDQRNRDLEEFSGCESVTLLNAEISSLWDVVFGFSNVTAMRNSYHDKLVELGAANVGWRCLEEVNEKQYTHDLSPIKLANWFLDYGQGKVFGPVESLDISQEGETDEDGTKWPSNADLVKTNGLLPPRTAESADE